MRKITSGEMKTTAFFGATGFVIPLALEAVWFFVNSHSVDPKLELSLQDFTFYVWPSSIMLMGIQHSGWVTVCLTVLISATVNAFLYAMVGLVLAVVYGKLRRAGPQG